jgi:hypothetical protein
VKSVTNLQAFNIMKQYLNSFYHKTKSDDIGSLLGDIWLLEDGLTADPAAWEDWVDSIKSIIPGFKNHDQLTLEQAFLSARKFLEGYYERTSSSDTAVIIANMKTLSSISVTTAKLWPEWTRILNNPEECNNELI